jgi:hypothetical protein
MADRAVMIALGTKLGPQQGASQMQGIIGALQKSATGIFGAEMGGIMAGGIAGGLAGVAASALTSLGSKAATLFSESFEISLQQQGEMKRFRTYFSGLAPEASGWVTDLSEKTGYCEKEMAALAGQSFNMMRAMGLTRNAAMGFSQQISKLSVDFAAFQGMKPEEAFQVIDGALAGSVKGLRQYGIVFSQTEKDAIADLQKTGDEAKVATYTLELLGQKMQGMGGAAAGGTWAKIMRENAEATDELKGAIGRFLGAQDIELDANGAPKKFGLAALLWGWKEMKKEVAAYYFGKSPELISPEQTEAAKALKAMETETETLRVNAENFHAKNKQRFLDMLDAEKTKLGELLKLAEDGDKGAGKAAELQSAKIKDMIAHNFYAQDALGMAKAQVKFDDAVKKQADDVNRLEEKRLETLRKQAEERKKQAASLAEQYGMMNAYERLQARNVLDKLKAGGLEAFQGMSEEEMRYAKQFAPEASKNFAAQIAGREGFPAIAAQLTAEINAKLEIDGPSLATQFVEKVFPLIQESINSTVGKLTGMMRNAQGNQNAVMEAAAL